jgi:alpha-beta hydrolase superfamily lysophospholipase
MDIRSTEGRFEGGGGRTLCRRSWLPENAESVLVVIHGFAEHSGRYEAFGSWFSGRGCAVHAYDHQGHGRSEGRRNHVRRFGDFLEDLRGFLELTRSEHPGLPCALVGHSMGGLIAAAFARERPPESLGLVGVVTSGAALSLGPALSRSKLLVARGLRRVAPWLTLDAGLPAEALSRDPEVVRRYVEDPLVGTRMTPSLAVELMDAVTRTAGGGGDVALPMLLLHGGADSLCAPAGSQAFFESLGERAAEHSALRVYPQLRHEIFNEPEQDEVFANVLEWIRERELDGLANPLARASQP